MTNKDNKRKQAKANEEMSISRFAELFEEELDKLLDDIEAVGEELEEGFNVKEVTKENRPAAKDVETNNEATSEEDTADDECLITVEFADVVMTGTIEDVKEFYRFYINQMLRLDNILGGGGKSK